MWRARYEELGVAGLVDEERPGRPGIYDHNDVALLVQLIQEDSPAPGTVRWMMEALAMANHDPDSWATTADVCGLYLNAPHNGGSCPG